MVVALRNLLLLITISVYYCSTQSVDFGDDEIVNTETGFIRGIVDTQYNVRKFLGIPYAEPANKYRFQSPVPRTSWSPSVLDCTKFGPCCPQNGGMGENLPRDEDCLFLNVYTPWTPTPPSQPYPVMVFIHGGGFVGGCSAQKVYYSDFFANSTNTIVVTINYRLGALGFFCNPEAGFPGNYGIQDQVLALRWVQSNIANFGGDPSRVTIFGESAGGMSVTLHLISPQTWKYKYFSRAITQSNPTAMQYKTKEEMQIHSDIFALWTNCSISNSQCFLNLAVQDIITAQGKTIDLPWRPSLALTELPWEPVIDPDYVPDQPLNLFKAGKIYPVPAIFGDVRNETLSFGLNVFQFLNITEVLGVEYASVVELFFQTRIFDVLKHYPIEWNSTDNVLNLSNDYIFICPTRNLAIYHSKAGNPTYHYSFVWSSPDDVINAQWIPCRQDGNVCHASELTFVFSSGILWSKLSY